MFLISSCCCLCSIQWSQVLSLEWRCSWSSADRRCSNYIWVIDNFIAYQGATYIRGFTVDVNRACQLWQPLLGLLMRILGGISLTFRKLSKIFSWNLSIAEIIWEFQAEALCVCHALGTRTKFQLEILTINVISGIVYFPKIVLIRSRSVNETNPWCPIVYDYMLQLI